MINKLPAFFEIWLISTLLLLLLQSYGGGLHQDQGPFFYVGYFATPILLAFALALAAHLVSKYLAKKN